MLADNIFEFINLMNENNNFVFTDRQARRMERTMANIEFGFGEGGYQPSEFVKRCLPKDFFSLLIVDEELEYKNLNSIQGQAMGIIASQMKKIWY